MTAIGVALPHWWLSEWAEFMLAAAKADTSIKLDAEVKS